MAKRFISQKSIVELMRALREYRGSQEAIEFGELLYEHDFPDWFVIHAENPYQWHWKRILVDVRDGRFFYSPYSYGHDSIVNNKKRTLASTYFRGLQR